MNKQLTEYAVDRLKEPSTWRGIIAIATAAGLQISPEMAVGIVQAGIALIGLIGLLLPDRVK